MAGLHNLGPIGSLKLEGNNGQIILSGGPFHEILHRFSNGRCNSLGVEMGVFFEHLYSLSLSNFSPAGFSISVTPSV